MNLHQPLFNYRRDIPGLGSHLIFVLLAKLIPLLSRHFSAPQQPFKPADGR
jgi:hypothetical protein